MYKQENMKKDYCCRRMKLYTYLVTRGFKVKRSKPDNKNPKYLVWFFDDTPELRECVEEYYSLIK